MCVILFATLAMLLTEGLWSNTIRLFNVITAALLATSLWEPLADWLDGQMPSFTYMVDFLALWLVFSLAYGVLRAATSKLSKIKVRFKKPLDDVGGPAMAIWVGWVLVCFLSMTLHTAPLAQNALAFSPDPNQASFVLFSPDHQWLGFAHKVSNGSLSRGNQFDPQGKFIYKYGQRRANYAAMPGALTE
jgi:hypothetical protein